MTGVVAQASGLVGLMVALAALETVVPRRGDGDRGRWPANLALAAVTFALNAALGAASAFVAADAFAAGAAASWTAIAVTVAVLDGGAYVAHRTMHHVPVLWRVHRLHHGDPFVDVTTAFRQHPLEGVWRFAWVAGPTWWLGLPVAGVVAHRLLSAANALLEHADVRLPRGLDAALSACWVTPDMHKVHHSRRQSETDSNYGNVLALYDRLLGTFTPSAHGATVSYGLDGAGERPASFAACLALPFRR